MCVTSLKSSSSQVTLSCYFMNFYVSAIKFLRNPLATDVVISFVDIVRKK